MEKQIQTFLVTAQEKEGCSKHGFSGVYKLQVGLAVAELLRCDSNEEVTNWPLHLIRKFGYTSQTFFLYAGTRCKTGEGKFIFYTLEGRKIAKCMTLQIAQIQNQQINHEDKEEIHTKQIQDKSKSQAVKTSSVRAHSGHVAHRITESGYTEPPSFLPPSSAKSKHTARVDGCRVVQPKLTALNIQSSFDEHEEDYYNSDLYSHLSRGGSRVQENVYGMASASAPLESSAKCTDDSNSYTYEYVD